MQVQKWNWISIWFLTSSKLDSVLSFSKILRFKRKKNPPNDISFVAFRATKTQFRCQIWGLHFTSTVPCLFSHKFFMSDFTSL
jgi:hypothetical protein